jgi:hypothetical protein
VVVKFELFDVVAVHAAWEHARHDQQRQRTLVVVVLWWHCGGVMVVHRKRDC